MGITDKPEEARDSSEGIDSAGSEHPARHDGKDSFLGASDEGDTKITPGTHRPATEHDPDFRYAAQAGSPADDELNNANLDPST